MFNWIKKRHFDAVMNGVMLQLNNMTGQLARLERNVNALATRAEFDQLKATLKADIAAIVQSVADLKAQLANGQPITDADLTDLQADIDTLTGGPAPVPPTP